MAVDYFNQVWALRRDVESLELVLMLAGLACVVAFFIFACLYWVLLARLRRLEGRPGRYGALGDIRTDCYLLEEHRAVFRRLRPDYPSLREVMTDRVRYSKDEVVLPAVVTPSDYYNYAYAGTEEVYFSFGVMDEQGEAYVYGLRCGETEELRRLCFGAGGQGRGMYIRVAVDGERSSGIVGRLVGFGPSLREMRLISDYVTLSMVSCGAGVPGMGESGGAEADVAL